MNIVLIPGAWMGEWIWEPIINPLDSLGHRVHTITLSGLQDEQEDISSVGLTTHVDQILSLLDTEGLEKAILVGHSYSGLVAGQAADRAPEQIVHTAFIEAFLPQDGKSLLDVSGLDPEYEQSLIDQNEGRWPPPNLEGLSHEPDLSDEQILWLHERLIGHPGRTITERVVMGRPLSELSATYIGRRLPQWLPYKWVYRKLEDGHWPMLSVPDDLSFILAEVAAHYE
jgi:pimeloyl-ACP methyl ester carboxylesterase